MSPIENPPETLNLVKTNESVFPPPAKVKEDLILCFHLLHVFSHLLSWVDKAGKSTKITVMLSTSVFW